MKKENRYSVAIEHTDWGQELCTKATKSAALREAELIICYGNQVYRDLTEQERENCLILVTDELTGETIFSQPFKKFYTTNGPERQNDNV